MWCTVAGACPTEHVHRADHRQPGACLPASSRGEGRRNRQPTHKDHDRCGEGALRAGDGGGRLAEKTDVPEDSERRARHPSVVPPDVAGRQGCPLPGHASASAHAETEATIVLPSLNALERCGQA